MYWIVVISANVSGIPELYKVKEYYRIRYSADRMYLLNYERRMEAFFDVQLASVSKSQLKLGITDEPFTPYLASPDKKKFALSEAGSCGFTISRTMKLYGFFPSDRRIRTI